MKIRHLATCIFFYFLVGFSYATSFDCSKASLPSEKIVCNNPALSKIDDQMFAAYSRAKNESANPELLKNEQISWIKEIRACGNDEDCIFSLYTKRINQLAQTTTGVSEMTTPLNQAVKDDSKEIVLSTEAQTSNIEAPSKVSLPQEAEKKDASQAEQVSTSGTQSSESKQKFTPTATESSIGYATGVLLYILSFILYIKKPKLRKISISTPFDIGCKNELSEAEQAVKGKKQWIEFGLLLLSLAIYMFVLSSGLESGTGILNAITSSFLAFTASFSIVVVGRFWAGSATGCPKCKNAFASKCTNSYTEPKGTFEKVSNGTSGARKVQFVKVMETGVKHADYLCTVCSHEWHVANQYTKQLSEHMRG